MEATQEQTSSGGELKARYIGNCSRLPVEIDGERLYAEVETLFNQEWDANRFRQVTHRNTVTCALRNNTRPLEKDIAKCEFEDLERLNGLPYARQIIHEVLPGRPCRCILAWAKPKSLIALHRDNYSDYYEATIRLHVPVVTNQSVSMCFGGLFYSMQPGELWAVNNDVLHGAINDDPENPRIHLICDVTAEPDVLNLLERGDRNLGYENEALRRRLAKSSRFPSLIRGLMRGVLRLTGRKIS